LAFATGDGRSAVRRAADDFFERHLLGERIRQADDDHAEVQQVHDAGELRRLLAAMLRGRRRHHGADFADHLAARPELDSLVPEVRHWSDHAAVARRDAENDRVVVGQLLRLPPRRILVPLHALLARILLRHQLGNALDSDLRAAGARAVRSRFRHLFHVAEGRLIENQYFRHRRAP
jgi:hypothetical protein